MPPAFAAAPRPSPEQRSAPLSRFFFQAEDGIRDADVTGVQTCALPIFGQLHDELGRADRDDVPAVQRSIRKFHAGYLPRRFKTREVIRDIRRRLLGGK